MEWSVDEAGAGDQIQGWHTVHCKDGFRRSVYIMEGHGGDFYHDWTHTNTDQDARRGVNPERRIDMMGELVISLWPYAGDFRRPGQVLSINRGVLIEAINAVGELVRGHVRVTDPDDSDEEPDHYCKPPNVCIPPGGRAGAPEGDHHQGRPAPECGPRSGHWHLYQELNSGLWPLARSQKRKRTSTFRFQITFARSPFSFLSYSSFLLSSRSTGRSSRSWLLSSCLGQVIFFSLTTTCLKILWCQY